jgi:hypothetical protein
VTAAIASASWSAVAWISAAVTWSGVTRSVPDRTVVRAAWLSVSYRSLLRYACAPVAASAPSVTAIDAPPVNGATRNPAAASDCSPSVVQNSVSAWSLRACSADHRASGSRHWVCAAVVPSNSCVWIGRRSSGSSCPPLSRAWAPSMSDSSARSAPPSRSRACAGLSPANASVAWLLPSRLIAYRAGYRSVTAAITATARSSSALTSSHGRVPGSPGSGGSAGRWNGSKQAGVAGEPGGDGPVPGRALQPQQRGTLPARGGRPGRVGLRRVGLRAGALLGRPGSHDGESANHRDRPATVLPRPGYGGGTVCPCWYALDHL